MFDFGQSTLRSLSNANKRNAAIMGVLGLFCLIVLLIWTGGEPDKAPRLPGVVVSEVVTKDVPVLVQALGTVMANATVQIKTRVEGPIVSAGFSEGQFVKKGDLLFRIDPAPYEASKRAAQANLQRDQAQLINARNMLKRNTELVKKGGVSAQAHDAALAEAKTAEAAVAASRAALDQADLNLSYTEIRSPVDGKTGAYLVDVGNVVNPSEQSPLVVVTQIQPVKIAFSLPQQYLPQLQQRLSEKALVVSLPDTPDGKPLTAPVDFISNSINEAAGTVELRATYANSDLRLVPGQFLPVAVRIELLEDTAIIPREAVNTGPDLPYAYVVDAENRIEQRPLDVLYQDASITAVGKGVMPGERVVTDGQMGVNPGDPVTVLTREQVN